MKPFELNQPTTNLSDYQFTLLTFVERLAGVLIELEQAKTDEEKHAALHMFAYNPHTRGYTRGEIEMCHDGFLYLYCAEQNETTGEIIQKPTDQDLVLIMMYAMKRRIDIHDEFYNETVTAEDQAAMHRERHGTLEIVNRLSDSVFTEELPDIVHTGATP